MKFSKLEEIMSEMGVSSLAEIARTLKTSPQAVSNWKSRDQVPYHIVNKINNIQKANQPLAFRPFCAESARRYLY